MKIVINALLTNIITNGLHFIFLSFYFCSALIHYLKKSRVFSIYLVGYFFSLCCLKFLGVCVHYFKGWVLEVYQIWPLIFIICIVSNYLLFISVNVAKLQKILMLILSFILFGAFLYSKFNFIYVAILVLVGYALPAYYSSGRFRYSFILVVVSNLVWIILRSAENFILGHEISLSNRYDNDIYHLLLIVSTFLIYRAFLYEDRQQKLCVT